MSKGGFHIGLDVGSVSANTVVVDGKKNVIEEHYTRLKGQPLETVSRVLADVLTRVPGDQIRSVSVTGTASKFIADLLGAEFINEIIAQSKSTMHFHPEVKTIIEMGGEDSKLILVRERPEVGGLQNPGFLHEHHLCGRDRLFLRPAGQPPAIDH